MKHERDPFFVVVSGIVLALLVLAIASSVHAAPAGPASATAGRLCPCSPAGQFRWLDAQHRSCTFKPVSACWPRVYLYQSPQTCKRAAAGYKWCGPAPSAARPAAPAELHRPASR